LTASNAGAATVRGYNHEGETSNPACKVEILHHRLVEIVVEAADAEAARKAAERHFGETVAGDRATSDFEAVDVKPMMGGRNSRVYDA
jgi:hypothetical protein